MFRKLPLTFLLFSSALVAIPTAFGQIPPSEAPPGPDQGGDATSNVSASAIYKDPSPSAPQAPVK